MAGRRLREAVLETLVSNGNGEFDHETHIVIAGLTNAYSQYVATFEEYQHQRYEVAFHLSQFYLTQVSFSFLNLNSKFNFVQKLCQFCLTYF